jgi:prophage antirepressor-like protein
MDVLPTIRKTGRYGTAADGQVSYGTYVVNNHAVRYVEMNGVRWSYLRDVCMAGGSHRPRIKPYTNQPYSQRMALVGIRGEVWCANPEGVTLVLERRRISGAQLSLFVGLSEKGGES